MGFLVYILLALKASDKQKVFKDEEVDKQRMEEKEKRGERNTDESNDADEGEYR